MNPLTPLDFALAYAAHGVAVFPVKANKEPLTKHGFKDASTDPAVIGPWFKRWAFAELAWAVPETVVVADLDEKHGKHGLADFERLEGVAPRDVITPITSTPSGGLQLFFDAAGRIYSNKVAINRTGIDVRTAGGSVVLPVPGNGRKWIRRLRTTPMRPAPTWLACAVKSPPRRRQKAAMAGAGNGRPDRSFAFRILKQACATIIAAERGSRDDTRHRQCFAVGALVAGGVIDFDTAYTALCAAAAEMDGASDWPDLDARVGYSLKRGMDQSDG